MTLVAEVTTEDKPVSPREPVDASYPQVGRVHEQSDTGVLELLWGSQRLYPVDGGIPSDNTQGIGTKIGDRIWLAAAHVAASQVC